MAVLSRCWPVGNPQQHKHEAGQRGRPQESETMKQEMLINVAQPEECRIAIVEDAILEELYIERTSQDNYVGNIYKGKVVNLEPSIQAAFVDFGVGRNGFLHISDIEPQYFRQGGFDPDRSRSSSAAARSAADIDTGEDDEEATKPKNGAAAPPPPRGAAARRRPAHQAADPGHPAPRRRGAGAGDQGRDRHQGADAFDLYQHSRAATWC